MNRGNYIKTIVMIALAVIAITILVGAYLFTQLGGNSIRYNPGSYNATSLTTQYKNDINLNWTAINGITGSLPAASPAGIEFETAPRIFKRYSLANSKLYVASNITYCTYRNQPLLMDLYANKPLNASYNAYGKRPIALYIFGGGYTSGNKTRFNGDMSPLLLGLVGKGFVVASINYLLAPNYTYPNQTNDVLCAMRFLKYYSYGFAGDQNQIGTFGNSVGGQLSSLAAVLNGTASWENPPGLKLAGNVTHEQYVSIPTRPYATADYYGGSQLPTSQLMISLLNKTNPAIHAMMEVFNYNTTLLSWASPTDFITHGEPPIMIVQGNNDTLNQEDLSTNFYNALKAQNNDATIIIVYNGDHELIPNPPNSTVNPSIENVTKSVVDFFVSHLSNPAEVNASNPQIIITPLNMSTSANSNYNNGSNSTATNRAQKYLKLYVGQNVTYRGFGIMLSGIDMANGKTFAVINISTNFDFSRTIGEKQYSYVGAFYLVVNQINASSKPAWITLNESTTIPNGFTNATFLNQNASNYTSNYSASPEATLGIPSNLSSCGTGNTMFDTLPIPLSDVNYIYPLGAVNSHIYPTDHIYFELNTNGGVPVKAPLSSPGNAVIYKIAGASYKTSTGARYNDYTLYFAGCKEFAGYFAHVYTISNKLLSNYTSPFSSCINYTEDISGWGLTAITYCIKSTYVKVSAGEQLGSAGGVAGASEALDFQTLDYRQTPLYFANATRNSGELYVACGIDYFTQALQNELYNHMGDYSSRGGFQLRSAYPRCGTIAQDINGTAQGDWANPTRANSTYPDAGVFALMHDAVIPSTLTFSLGGSAIPGLYTDTWLTFKTATSGYVNRDFSNVTANGHVYCYDNLQNEYGNSNPSGIIIMQLINSSTLRIEYQNNGYCSSSNSFTNNHVDFYR